MGRCEDEKMIYRPSLLEEPFAQTLPGKNRRGSKKKTGGGQKKTLWDQKNIGGSKKTVGG